jgi:hypothetical protein
MSIVTVLVLCISVVVLGGFLAWRHDQCALRARLTRCVATRRAKATKVAASHSNEVVDC